MSGRTRLHVGLSVVAAIALLLPAGVAHAAPPTNDNFSNAAVMTSALPSNVVGDTNVEATKESDVSDPLNELFEPDHAGNPGGASVWYSWVAPSSGVVTIDTFGSSFDTILGVYTGASVYTLTNVASNDSAGGGDQSKVTLAVVSGTNYLIAVDGYGGATGTVDVNIATAPAAPSNDAFANAIAMAGLPADRSGDTNIGATKQLGEPAHAGNGGGASVWYSWTAAADGMVSIDTFGSDFNTLLAVYTGAPVGSLTLIDSDDQASAGSDQSKVKITVVSGTTYMIAVDGFEGATGNVEVHIADYSPPNTTINSGPTGTVASPDATFTFSADEPSTFKCKIDLGIFSTCTSPKTYLGLANGAHTFTVKAVDAEGTPDASPATRTWTASYPKSITTLSINTPVSVPRNTNAHITGNLGSVNAACVGGQLLKLKKGTKVLQTQLTAPDGSYDFDQLIAGSWTLKVNYAGNLSCKSITSIRKTIAVT